MTLLSFFLITSGIVILIIALDIAKKQKFNAIHFFVFLFVGIFLLVFSIYPNVLDKFGKLFGVARGADVLVYGSIVFLLYFVLLLLKRNVENNESITKIIREMAINDSIKKEISGKEVFLVRVFNEAPVLENTINKILNEGYKNILVVNDGSTDNSKQILEKFGDKILLLNHNFNRGGGASLETGFEYLRRYSKTEYVITFDADGQHYIEEAKNFIEELDREKDIEIIFGSRFLEQGGVKNIPFFRKVILFGGKIFTALISGVYLTDSHNGYRIFRTETLKKIHLSMDTMAYASELIEEIKKNKIKFKEIPVHIEYTEYSLGKGQKNSNAIDIALKLIWSKFFR